MKKLFAVLLALAMLLCGFAFAEEEYLDMDHDTAVLFLDGVQYDYTILSVSNPGNGYIDAIFEDANGNYFGIAIGEDIGSGYYTAAAGGTDYATIMLFTADGRSLVSSCSDYGYEKGYPCEMYVSAFDVDNWYQILAMGTMINEETGETYEMTTALDFYWDDGDEESAPVPVPAPFEVPEEAAEEAAQDVTEGADYFVPDTLILVVDEYYGEMEILEIDYDGDVFVRYGDDLGNTFAIGVYNDLENREYLVSDVNDEYCYFMFGTADGEYYMGGCSTVVDDDYNYGFVEMSVVSNGTNGLYQIGLLGELINIDTGAVAEVAGFADFTVEELK